MSKRDLWDRLRNYHFEHVVPPRLTDKVSSLFGGTDASTQAFASKLSNKLGWSRPFALRAIDEYKKFVYLGNVGSMNVTPSRVIDQVWHEHILFSRAYREFCRDVVGRDFDHNPELLPLAEQTDVFAQQYLDTLDAYRTEFNAMPPADIWSAPKFRNAAMTREPQKLERPPVDHWGSDLPLFVMFSSGESGAASSPEFGGGGGFSGGGSDRSWGDSGGDDGGHDAGSDAGGSDGGDGGGGSSCSSSCGGGGE